MISSIKNLLSKEIVFKNIIFDLDGTLVDSSKGIIETFKYILKENQINPIIKIENSLIGPPLIDALRIITGIEDPNILKRLGENFKTRYDSVGYLKTNFYDEVPKLLEKLYFDGHTLYIATNKREFAAKKIVHYFEWEKYFKNIFSLDSFNPNLRNKEDLIRNIILQENIESKECYFIGDRLSDQAAARNNYIDFYLADWGYEKSS